jgi:hypothetical protein
MKAYLTFIRKINDDIHMLGVSNPNNLHTILDLNLISGQPILVITESGVIVAFYCLNQSGELFQTKGNVDLLFELTEIQDLTLQNIKKYNTIKHLLNHCFSCLSLKELTFHQNDLEHLENKIFYNYLHTDIDVSKMKFIISKEIIKSSIKYNIKKRLLDNLKKTRNPNKKIIRKKIDIDLLGYGIHINTLIS